MKIIIAAGIMLGLLFVFMYNDPEPIYIPTKVIRVNDAPKTRYFLIGYNIGDQQRGSITWIAYSGSIPLKTELLKALHASKNVSPFLDRDFVIIGLYEFKNEDEMNIFDSNNQSN